MLTLDDVWKAVKNRPPTRSYEQDLEDWKTYTMEKIKTYDQLVKVILEEARSWIGVPFHHQGRTKMGCDCIGVGLSVARRIGFEYKDNTRYGRLPHNGLLENAFMEHMVPIDIKEIRPSDGVLLTWKTEPHHVGIVTEMESTGELGILHSYQTVGKVVEHHLDDEWRNRIVMAFRFPLAVKLLKKKDKRKHRKKRND
jgi:hypothetical protein